MVTGTQTPMVDVHTRIDGLNKLASDLNVVLEKCFVSVGGGGGLGDPNKDQLPTAQSINSKLSELEKSLAESFSLATAVLAGLGPNK